ncbi:MAG: glycosyltransferase [Myxococcota bacterium]
MIFVTVGGQLPFDRLVESVDRWAGDRGRGDLFAQIGDGRFVPTHVPFERFLDPRAFAEKLEVADAVVAHAGMGTILSALELGKPVVVLPRLHAQGEHRNDHQVATAARLSKLAGIYIADDEQAIPGLLDQLESLPPGEAIDPRAAEPLVARIRAYIQEP